jgi:hypothetical protein
MDSLSHPKKSPAIADPSFTPSKEKSLTNTPKESEKSVPTMKSSTKKWKTTSKDKKDQK